MMFIIYKAINNINGKSYVGQQSGRSRKSMHFYDHKNPVEN